MAARVKAYRAQVIINNCTICRDALLADCKSSGLPIPTAELIEMTERWRFHKCPHMEDGLVLKFDDGAVKDTDDAIESIRWKGEEEIEDPAWRHNLDATKGLGYPAREEGRYGSPPSHDDFDDESES